MAAQATMQMLGNLQEFNPDNETIVMYLERMQMFSEVNNVEDAKRVPVLLTAIGAKNYLLLRDLVSPATPREKSLDELVKVLKFGIASAPAIFQRTMDTLLQGMEGVMCYIDDILVTDKSQDEHLHQLEEVLTRLQKHGLKVGKNKCSFLQPSVEYLGHQIDSEMEALPVTTAQLRYHTRRDPLLGKICKRKLAQQNVSGCTSFQTKKEQKQE